MTDRNHQSGPHINPAAEASDVVVKEQESNHTAPSSGHIEKQLSYDQRVAAALEAARQIEADLCGKSARLSTRRAGLSTNR